MSRVLFDAIVPWWHGVAAGNVPEDAGPITPAYAEFAALQHAIAKVVFSRSRQSTPGTTVISGDLARQLALELIGAKVFAAGCVVLRHRVLAA